NPHLRTGSDSTGPFRVEGFFSGRRTITSIGNDLYLFNIAERLVDSILRPEGSKIAVYRKGIDHDCNLLPGPVYREAARVIGLKNFTNKKWRQIRYEGRRRRGAGLRRDSRRCQGHPMRMWMRPDMRLKPVDSQNERR